MNRPESNGAVPWNGMRGRSLVNLLGRACIQRVEGNVLADRLAPSGSGSHKK